MKLSWFNKNANYLCFPPKLFITDAGKSTAGGQILLLSGQVDERSIQKYEKEAKDKSRDSWYVNDSRNYLLLLILGYCYNTYVATSSI